MSPAELHQRQIAHADSYMLLAGLPDIADHLQAQLIELHKRPTPERAERMATELEGIRRHVLNVRAALQREAAGGTPTA